MSNKPGASQRDDIELRYRAEIDGLRAIAVVPVILFHGGIELFGGGFVGVDIFFVISGYLITSIILSEKEAGTFSILNFYERRARRILPALFFVMFVCTSIAWVWLPPNDMKGFSQSLVAVSTFSSNILFWHQSGYFATESELKPLLHTWSLAIEEQYYMLFPLFIMLMWRFGKKSIAIVLAGLSILSLAAAQLGSLNAPSATFYLLHTRGWELLIGALVAFYLSGQTGVKGNQVLSLAGLGLVAYSVFMFDEQTPFPGFYALVPTIGVALIILFTAEKTLVHKVLSNKIMVSIGLISYSIYLWHQPLFAFARHGSVEALSTQVIFGLIFCSIAFAYLSWRFVEKPFRDKKRFGATKIFALSFVCSTIFISFGLVGHFSKGFPFLRATEQQAKLLASAQESPMRDKCHVSSTAKFNSALVCQYHNENGTWAVFGDSHTVEFAFALANELKNLNEGVRHFSKSGCAPAFNTTGKSSSCSVWTDKAIAAIVNDPDIKNVVVSYRIHSYLHGKNEGIYPNFPDEISSTVRDIRWKSYIEILDTFVAANKNVFLILQAPELPKSINNLIFNDKNPVENLIGVDRRWWKHRVEFVMSRLGEVPGKVSIINPADYFCDAQKCLATMNGTSLYFDDDHMSVAGATIIAKQIIDNVE